MMRIYISLQCLRLAMSMYVKDLALSGIDQCYVHSVPAAANVLQCVQYTHTQLAIHTHVSI